MNRIEQIFRDLRSAHPPGKALMPFVTAGDPDIQTTGELLLAFQNAGAAICEIGFPFSDPIADGPIIQASMSYALEHAIRPQQILEVVAAHRNQLTMGLLAMVSYSIVHRLGVNSFVRDAAQAGIDGLIVPDLPPEEAKDLRDAAAQANLTCSFLIAPTTPDARALQIAQACTGFVYVLSRAGLTGERQALPVDLTARLAALRRVTDLPMAVGFGISTSDQVRAVVQTADAAIVGSVIVRRIAELRDQGRGQLVHEVGGFVRELCSGLAGR